MLSAYPNDYSASRTRFRELAIQQGWGHHTYAIGCDSPDGEPLTIDVAITPGTRSDCALIVSSGVHGVEAPVGAAAQLVLLERWHGNALPRCIFIHAVNPYGYAWHRRFNEDNIDLNRNFLLQGEAFQGAPPTYTKLNRILNPTSPPPRLELFTVQALATIARHGMPALKQAIVSGQYEFPQGLFFGGKEPAASHRIMAEHFAEWLGDAQRIVHLDIHTGLGNWGDCKLLIDRAISDERRQQLDSWFGPDSYELATTSGISYQARGGWGEWCDARVEPKDYFFACVEHGTYTGLKMLAGLRAENRAHQWGKLEDARTIHAKEQLRELFCPRSEAWRMQVLNRNLAIAEQARAGLLNEDD